MHHIWTALVYVTEYITKEMFNYSVTKAYAALTPFYSSQYDGNNQDSQEVGVYKSINTSINVMLNVLPKAAIIGSICRLIVSFVYCWLSGNILAEVSFVLVLLILRMMLDSCTSGNHRVSLFHYLKEKILLPDFLPWVEGAAYSFATQDI